MSFYSFHKRIDGKRQKDISPINMSTDTTIIQDQTWSNIYEKIKGYEYVSFDVFDTLIFRTVQEPSDIFLLVEEVISQKENIKIPTFHIKRKYAEYYARRKHNREVNLNEIYEEIDYCENLRNKLKSLEVECEIKNCVANRPMLDLLQACRNEGKKIIITTDMYLPRACFEQIFLKIGVQFDFLFISGEEKATKKDGILFQIVLEKMGISAGELVHIGDNKHSDINMPRKYGIMSVERVTKNNVIESYLLKKDLGIKRNHLERIFAEGFQNYEQNHERFRIGYTIYGPYLYTFCCWVHEQKLKYQFDKLLFLARDGYLIKLVYEIIFPEERDSIDYISLNKNLMRLPSLVGDNKRSNLLRSLPPREHFLWKELFIHIGIENTADIERLMKERFEDFDINVPLQNDKLSNGDYDDKLDFILTLQEPIIKEQAILLRQYLHQVGVIGNRVGLVNNSMKGSAQILLNQYAERNNLSLDLYGVQFTASSECRKRLGNRVLCFYSGDDFEIRKELFNYHCLEYEHALFEHVGTARKFVLSEDGHVEILKDKSGKEELDFPAKDEIQKCAVAFSKDYMSHIGIDIVEIAKKRMENLFFMPTKEDALLIGGFWDKDVEGTRQLLNFNYNKVTYSLLWKHKPLAMGWMSGSFSFHNKPRWFLFLYKIRVIGCCYLKDINKLWNDIHIFVRQFTNNTYHSVVKYIRVTSCLIRYKYMFILYRVKKRILSNEY